MAERVDRRRERRYGARIDVRFSRAEDAARALNAYSLNFSAGGLCVRTKHDHQVGQRLDLDITIEGNAFQLEAEVAWTRGQAMGLRFINVPPSDRQRLESVARRLGKRGGERAPAPPKE